MGGYIINFTVYTLAMSGLIFCALFVYKKVMNGSLGVKNSNNLTIEETLNINPRKSLIIVRADNERFLIASDVDKTTLISKLCEKSPQNLNNMNNFDTVITEIPQIYNESTIPNKTETINEPVHLEVISEQNPSGLRRKNSYTSRSYAKKKEKMNDYEFSTMKEMASKINRM